MIEVFDPFTGDVMQFDEGVTENDVFANFASSRARRGIQGGMPPSMAISQQLSDGLFQPQNMFGNMLQNVLGPQPQSTLPDIGAKELTGLSPQQAVQTIQTIQQDKQSQVQQAETIRQEREASLQAEKDRAQQIRLEEQRFKNDQAHARLQAQLQAEQIIPARADADVDVAERTGQIDQRRAITADTEAVTASRPSSDLMQQITEAELQTELARATNLGEDTNLKKASALKVRRDAQALAMELAGGQPVTFKPSDISTAQRVTDNQLAPRIFEMAKRNLEANKNPDQDLNSLLEGLRDPTTGQVSMERAIALLTPAQKAQIQQEREQLESAVLAGQAVAGVVPLNAGLSPSVVDVDMSELEQDLLSR